MAFYGNRSLMLDGDYKRGTRRPLGPVGHRLAAALRKGDSRDLQGGSPIDDEPDSPTDQLSRFPLVRRGYDCAAVDEYVSELEAELAALDRELAERRGGSAAAQEVATEIKRIGEQTSAVLMAANQQRDEIVAQARAEAERCVSEATATADARTAKCEQRLRELGARTEVAQSERDRLLEDVRKISAALIAIADSGQASPEP